LSVARLCKVFNTGKIVPNEEKTRLVQEMFRLATFGLGSKMIIRRLGLTIPLRPLVTHSAIGAFWESTSQAPKG
jgi:hypothetical protein